MKHPSRGLIGRYREPSEADEAVDAAASGTRLRPSVLISHYLGRGSVAGVVG